MYFFLVDLSTLLFLGKRNQEPFLRVLLNKSLVDLQTKAVIPVNVFKRADRLSELPFLHFPSSPLDSSLSPVQVG